MRSSPIRLIQALFLIALGLATYLLAHSFSNDGIAGCAEAGCNAVLESKWSRILGIPISLPGAICYLLMIGLAPRRDSVLRGLTVFVVLLGAAWFVILQAFVIGSFCPWCCITHLFAVAGCCLSLHTQAWASRRQSLLGFAPALAVTMAVAMVQFFQSDPKPGIVVVEMNTSPSSSKMEEGTATSTSEPIPEESLAAVNLHGDQFALAPADFPLMGTSNSKHFCVALVSYGCGYCRKLLNSIESAQASLGEEQLGVILLPVGSIGKAGENHRILLATWKFAPATFDILHHSIVSGKVTIKPDALREFVSARESSEALEVALNEHADWIDMQLDLAKQILVANNLKLKKSRLPHFIVGDRIIVGAPDPLAMNDAMQVAFGMALDVDQMQGSQTQSVAKVNRPEEVAPSAAKKGSDIEKPAPVAPEPSPQFVSLIQREQDRPQGFKATNLQMKSPGLSFENGNIDLGSVPPGEPVQVMTKVSNSGEGMLRITGINRFSDCRATTIFPLLIPPGETRDLHLEITPQKSGPFRRKLKLTSNVLGTSNSVTLVARIEP